MKHIEKSVAIDGDAKTYCGVTVQRAEVADITTPTKELCAACWNAVPPRTDQ